MNLIVIPYHDWRKCEKEGFRTRDAHLIQHFLENPDVEKVIIINRPITAAEMLIKRINWKSQGEVCFSGKDYQLVQVHPRGYVLDTFSHQSLQNIILQKKWYFRAYAAKTLINTIELMLAKLNINSFNVVCFNVFASQLMERLTGKINVFDAWDNWLRFPHNHYFHNQLLNSYQNFSRIAQIWITNSERNSLDYKSQFHINQCHVVKNGVDPERFQKLYPIPKDMENLPKPIIGFGGKITHLFDPDLLNTLVKNHPSKSFVIVGPIIDPKKFSQIIPQRNLFYFGDKHYDIYPAYITNFDICIMPYVIGEKEHGGDAIKLYEYIATGKLVISTSGNGALGVKDYIEITDDADMFSSLLSSSINNKRKGNIPEEYTWAEKAKRFMQLMLNQT
jgi:teichuronic acid biosynthesis glycosyltransferase TuaH